MKLRKWIMSGKSITPLQALHKFGISRLGARILELRREGYNIVTEMTHKNGKRFAKYTLAYHPCSPACKISGNTVMPLDPKWKR
jgi:hypothetical protein